MTLVRFAPSPTGYLHVGNVRTALINWLFARKTGGRFMLRIDDTDTGRSKQEFEDAIAEDLAWLGLTWDSSFKQSERFARYDLAIEALKAAGRLYPCYEKPEELEIKRKMQTGRGLPPVYDRASLKLTEAQKAEYEKEGRKPHWRFLLTEKEVKWNDLVRGESKFNPTHMSDPVLIREDGVPLYTLASVVDDGEMNVTHIVRGEDHVSNTAVQVQIFEALGFSVPQFAHTALLKTKEGELSKRVGGSDIRSMRVQGIMPMAINSLLAKIGTSDPVEAVETLQALVESFDFAKFGRAPANFDMEELHKLNEKLIRTLPFSQVKDRLPISDEAFWHSIRSNIKSLDEANDWWRIVNEEVSAPLAPEDHDFLKQSAALLPPEPWDEGTYNAWIEQVKNASGRKGKPLFMPIRLALTGMEHGPELKALLPLLGREKTLARLSA